MLNRAPHSSVRLCLLTLHPQPKPNLWPSTDHRCSQVVLWCAESFGGAQYDHMSVGVFSYFNSTEAQLHVQAYQCPQEHWYPDASAMVALAVLVGDTLFTLIDDQLTVRACPAAAALCPTTLRDGTRAVRRAHSYRSACVWRGRLILI